MEKITLKPVVKELIYKGGEDNVHFDVLSYQGAGAQEKMLGSLFVLGHIKYAEENMAYAVSLISSLAKREYYSEASLREQNAKSAFEHTLKKLNEVLEDFFQNKNFKLNIGLAVISGENIYISRLGKFKIALARGGKYIDILNNVELFSKDSEGEKQFSNIISGKIQPDDKIFAYFPSRSITAREKQLNEIFVKENQDEFSQKIAKLAANAANFSCCGVHIDLKQIKEIPIQSPATYVKPVLSTKIKSGEEKIASRTSEISLTNTDPTGEIKDIKQQHDFETQTPTENLETEQSRIIPAEFLVSRRSTVFTMLLGGLQKLASMGRWNTRARRHTFVLISAVVLIPILTFVLLKTGGSDTDKNILKQAGENLKLAQSRITQNNPKDARSLLQTSLLNLTDLSGKKAEDTKQQLNQTLDGIDHVSDKQPALFADPAANNKDFKANFITALQDRVYATDTDGNVFAVGQNEVASLGQLKTIPQFIFSDSSFVSVFNGSDTFSSYDLKTQKTNTYSLKEPVQAYDAVLYESNLYTLSNNAIYKYADATTGGIKRTVWASPVRDREGSQRVPISNGASDNESGNLTAITADGNIYALTNEGKMIKYFKGKKTGELDLQVIPSSDIRLFTYKDSAFIYLADKANKRVYIFDKENGSLKTAYKLDAAGTIQDIFVSPDSTVWILSTDNKIWKISP